MANRLTQIPSSSSASVDKDHQIDDLEAKSSAAEAKASALEQQLQLLKQKADDLQKAVVEQATRAEDLQTQLTVANDKVEQNVH
jgi:hypothetical protein